MSWKCSVSELRLFDLVPPTMTFELNALCPLPYEHRWNVSLTRARSHVWVVKCYDMPFRRLNFTVSWWKLKKAILIPFNIFYSCVMPTLCIYANTKKQKVCLWKHLILLFLILYKYLRRTNIILYVFCLSTVVQVYFLTIFTSKELSNTVKFYFMKQTWNQSQDMCKTKWYCLINRRKLNWEAHVSCWRAHEKFHQNLFSLSLDFLSIFAPF